MNIADRLRRFRRRPKAELVRVQPVVVLVVEPPEPLALPAPPRVRRRNAGLGALYGGRTFDDADDPYGANPRPRPLGRDPAHDKALYRDQVNPWRNGTPDPPPAGLDLQQIREELHAPRTDWPYHWERRDSSSHRPRVVPGQRLILGWLRTGCTRPGGRLSDTAGSGRWPRVRFVVLANGGQPGWSNGCPLAGQAPGRAALLEGGRPG